MSNPEIITDAAEIGALEQWRAEVLARRNGQNPKRPSTWRHDALYVAACLELAGIEAKRAGLPRTAAMYFSRAMHLIMDAAAERA